MSLEEFNAYWECKWCIEAAHHPEDIMNWIQLIFLNGESTSFCII